MIPTHVQNDKKVGSIPQTFYWLQPDEFLEFEKGDGAGLDLKYLKILKI